VTTTIPLPLSSYTDQDPRASSKRLVGCFSELLDTDAPPGEAAGMDTKPGQLPATLHRMPGIRNISGFDDGSGTPVRGYWEMAGVEYVVIGPHLYSVTVSPISNIAILSAPINSSTNLISGFQFVRMTDNGACLVILNPGSTDAWTYTPNAMTGNILTTSTLVGGTAYVPGTYLNVPLTGGTGTGALANINVNAVGHVSLVTIVVQGSGYTPGDVLTASNVNLGGTGSGFSITVATVGSGTQFLKLTNPFFTTLGAIDLWFVDTYIVFLALNGTSFFNDDGRQVSGSNQITFTTAASFVREFGTDVFVGGIVDHREVMLFGRRTTEGYLNAGNPVGSPFSSAADSFMEIGSHPLCAYAIAKQDQSVFWVANDLTVRRRNGQTPTRISNSGIEFILRHANLTGCYALTPTAGGHPLWILNMPQEQRTVVYNCLTQKWFELTASGPTSYYRPLAWHNAFGLQLMADSQSSATGFLDDTIGTEFGAAQVVEFTTQPVYDKDNRIVHRRLELITTMGEGVSPTVPPTVTLYVSDNSGRVFESFDDTQTLGTQGQDEGTGQRATWWQLGQSRNRVYKWRITDATPLFTVDIQATLEGGMY
jgi:hypothetical protein